MTLLEEFVFSLSKTERAKIRPLQFRGIKRKIFLAVLSCRDPEGINQEKIVVRNKLSIKRFYQMVGEMLHACYYDVAPRNGTDLLQYLGNMQLYRHFYHEMKQQETYLLSKKNKKQLEDFYFKVLLMSEFFLIPKHKAGHIRSELAKYLRRYSEVKTPHPCDKCFIRTAEIEQDIFDNFLRDFSIERLRKATDELEEILDCLKNENHALAKFKASYLLATVYFGNYFKDKTAEPFLDYIDRLVSEHEDIFGSVGGLIKLGIQSYKRPKKEDIAQYQYELQHPSPTGEGASLLCIERLFPLIITSGELVWAKKFIAEHFPLAIDQLSKDIAAHWWRLVMMYHLYADEYSAARAALSKAAKANTGASRSVDLDINFRCYDLYLLVMLEGPELAADDAARHIRFAKRHGYNRGEGFMMMFLKAVSDLVSKFDKDNARKARDRYIKELAGEGRLFPLFEKIYQKYFI